VDVRTRNPQFFELVADTFSVQEVVFSLEVVLTCGRTELSWLRMATTIRSMREIYKQTSSQIQTAESNALHRTADLWFNNCVQSSPTPAKHIFDLATEFSTYECTDARDRIYAIHALSNGNNAQTKIDYTLDTCKIYCQFARSCMVEGRVMDVFDAAILRMGVPSNIRVPSWVPDWTRRPKRSTAYRGDRFRRLNEDLFEIGTVEDPNRQKDILSLNIAGIPWFDVNSGTERFIPNSWRVCTNPMSLEPGFSSTRPFAAFKLFMETGQGGITRINGWGNCGKNILREVSGISYRVEHINEMSELRDSAKGCPEKDHEEMDVDMKATADPMNGYCFFGARSTHDDTEYFCYAPPGVLRGDRLVLVECLHDLYAFINDMQTYRAFVFRYEENATTSDTKHGDVEGRQELTRLVGEAFLVSARRILGVKHFRDREAPRRTWSKLDLL
jgi:hypothetical protein